MKHVVLKRVYLAILFFLVSLTIPIQAAADDPFMVKDIELAQDLYYGVEGEFALVNDILFFVAHTGPYGTEVWKYEEGSASLLKDIRPGNDSSVPSQLTSVDGILYFIANDGIHGIELWKSDGTTANTGMVEDINPSGDSSPSHLTNCNNTLYFNANDSINGLRLWKSDDGTDAGTDIVSTKVWGSEFIWVNDIVLFSGAEWDSTFNYYEIELWKTDGTEDNTEMVKQIEAGPNSGFPEYLTNVNGTVYFAGRSDYSYGPSGVELWKSDGTEFGTVQVKDINPGALASFPNYLTNLNGFLYFTANDQTNGKQLWKSDGTEPGTVMVQDSESLVFFRPQNLAEIAGTLYFMAKASDGMGGNEVEVWKSDGTAAGSERLKNIRPDTYDSGFPADPTFTNVNGTLYFTIDDGINGTELWLSDGTESGTQLVKDIFPDSDGSSPGNLIAVDDTLFFSANDGYYGPELWMSDGTEEGTVMAADVGTKTRGSDPWGLIDVNGILYFVAETDLEGQELWKSNGTEAGTVMVEDINPGENRGVNGENLIDLNGTVYFFADDGINGLELWKSDGTEPGTDMVKDLNPTLHSDPRNLVAVDNTLFFSANRSELWMSDGTEFGTVIVKDIDLGVYGSTPGRFTDVNGTLYFAVNNDVNGQELWVSDGTDPGTVMVKDINPGEGDSYPNFLANVNGVLYFSANDGINGTELWKSDGTEDGTVMIKDIRSDGNGSPSWITDVNGTAYFFANDGVNGSELWKSDGTPDGTVMVKDINPSGSGIQGKSADALANINGTLYFCADDGIHGSELWKTDGTEDGTVMLKDLNPDGDGYPGNFTDVNGVLYFRARSTDPDFLGDNTLWASDGTANGTDMVPNFLGYGLDSLTNVDGSLYFTAYDGEHGKELWVMFSIEIFADGFESGNTSAWSKTVP